MLVWSHCFGIMVAQSITAEGSCTTASHSAGGSLEAEGGGPAYHCSRVDQKMSFVAAPHSKVRAGGWIRNRGGQGPDIPFQGNSSDLPSFY